MWTGPQGAKIPAISVALFTENISGDKEMVIVIRLYITRE